MRELSGLFYERLRENKDVYDKCINVKTYIRQDLLKKEIDLHIDKGRDIFNKLTQAKYDYDSWENELESLTNRLH